MTAPSVAKPSPSVPVVAAIAWLVVFVVLVVVTATATTATTTSDAPPIVRPGRQLAPNTPNARASGEAMLVANRREAPLTILAVANPPLRAEDYGLVTLQAGDVPRGIELALIWVRVDDPGRPHEQVIDVSGARAIPTLLDRNAEWKGSVRFLAIGVKGVADRPVEIRAFRLEPLGTSSAIADVVRAWTRFERWDGRSINVLFGGRDMQRAWLPPLAFLAALIAALVARTHAMRRDRRPTAAALALPFLIAWIVVDARWQANLFHQARETLADFGGRSYDERHLAMEDGDLFRFARAAMEKLPNEPVRVFATSDIEYYRRRAGYHLYPHNVLAYDWADPGVIRPGDYLFLFQKNDVRYDGNVGELQWSSGAKLAVEPLLARRGAGLFRAKASQP